MSGKYIFLMSIVSGNTKTEIPVSTQMSLSWAELSDEDFMKLIEKIDESAVQSSPFSILKSTKYTKIGENGVKFISYGRL